MILTHARGVSTPVGRLLVILCFVVAAASLRVLPHPWNFTPVGAMAIFAGAKLGHRWSAYLFPFTTLILGDLFLGFHRLILVVYLSFAASVAIGAFFRNRQSVRWLTLATLLGAAQFFLVTNFAVWIFMSHYPKSLSGLVACYIAGIPFFGNTLAGDFLYATLLFGGFALAERLSPALRTQHPVPSF
jgi:hypothetical protein